MDSIPHLKRCVRCGTLKPRSEFRKQKAQRDGLHPYCKPCCLEYARAYYQKQTPEQRKANHQVQYERHKDDYKARAKRRYQGKRAEIVKYVQGWLQANPDKRRAYHRKMYAKNPEPKRETWRRRKACIHAVTVVPFDPALLKLKVEYWGGRCWICGGPYQEIDHVKPINKGGLHVLCNLRPVCIPCNRSKADRWPYP